MLNYILLLLFLDKEANLSCSIIAYVSFGQLFLEKFKKQPGLKPEEFLGKLRYHYFQN